MQPQAVKLDEGWFINGWPDPIQKNLDMLVEAVVTKGQFQFLQPIQFAHDQVHVMVDIPDGEIVACKSRQTGLSKSLSSVLIKQLWAARIQIPNDASDLLNGIEKKYE